MPSDTAQSSTDEPSPSASHLRTLLRVQLGSLGAACVLNAVSSLWPSLVLTLVTTTLTGFVWLAWRRWPATPRSWLANITLAISLVTILTGAHIEGPTRHPNLMFLAPFLAAQALLLGPSSSGPWLTAALGGSAVVLAIDVARGNSTFTLATTYFLTASVALGVAHAIGVAAARIASEAIAQARANAEQLERANAELETALRAKSDFLSSVSHELRTPLHAISGFTDLLLDTPLSDEQRGQLQSVHLAGQSLRTVVDDLLDLATLERRSAPLARAPVDLTPLVRDVAAMLSLDAREKGLSLSVADEHQAHVLANESRLRQVLLHLVGNAIKFTDHGSVTVRVALSTGSASHERVEIIDTGIGIDEEARARLFSPFEQLESGQVRRHGGPGLGLAISRRLVEAMGGAIGVDSAPGKGSTFWFELPRADAPPVGSRQPASAPTPTPGLRVLVVEDNAVNRRLVARQLEPFGCATVVVEGGAQALDELAQRPFDLVLMDVQMPEMDGLEATRRIRAFEASQGTPRTRVIALSASVLEEDLARCRDAGMDGHLAKPASRDDLARVLATTSPSALRAS